MQSANQKIDNPKPLVNQPDYNDADQLSMQVLGLVHEAMRITFGIGHSVLITVD